jgi:hypothetical protein
MAKKLDKSLMMDVAVPGEALDLFEDHYAVWCYLNGQQKLTHTLTKQQATYFRQTARHLAKYLTKTYKLGK